MKTWKIKILTLLSLAGITYKGAAQTKSLVTESYKVDGNCGMCQKTIEGAASKKAKTAKWNKDTKELSITYAPQKASADEILKDVAYAGYDNEKYMAPLNAYQHLPECCQYERSEKAKNAIPKQVKTNLSGNSTTAQTEQGAMAAVYNRYFDLKDALVKSDGGKAAAAAKEFLTELNLVKVASLSTAQQQVFQTHFSFLKSESSAIAATTSLDELRTHFALLSEHLLPVVKSNKATYPIYLEHCPMYNDGKGADWISKENQIKNPYYGTQMLNCGKVVETIK